LRSKAVGIHTQCGLEDTGIESVIPPAGMGDEGTVIPENIIAPTANAEIIQPGGPIVTENANSLPLGDGCALTDIDLVGLGASINIGQGNGDRGAHPDRLHVGGAEGG